MHSFMHRCNTLFTFFGSVAAVVCAVTSFTGGCRQAGQAAHGAAQRAMQPAPMRALQICSTSPRRGRTCGSWR